MSTEQPATPASVAPHHNLVVPSIAGLVAALVGGVVWAIVVQVSGYEVGFAAVGIGLLAGFAAGAAARGQAGEALPFVVAATAAVGVAFGKVLTLYLAARDVAEQYVVPEGPLSLTLHNLAPKGFWSPFDALWLFFAVSAAYRVTAARLQSGREAGPTGEQQPA